MRVPIADTVLVAGLVTGLLLIATVVATGNTFGQRCERVYSTSTDVQQCVRRLKEGGPLQLPARA